MGIIYDCKGSKLFCEHCVIIFTRGSLLMRFLSNSQVLHYSMFFLCQEHQLMILMCQLILSNHFPRMGLKIVGRVQGAPLQQLSGSLLSAWWYSYVLGLPAYYPGWWFLPCGAPHRGHRDVEDNSSESLSFNNWKF